MLRCVLRNRSMHALYKQLGIDTGLTTAYHPQANGQLEHKNQEVEAYLHLFIGKRQEDWADLLPTAKFVINSHLNSAPTMLCVRQNRDVLVRACCEALIVWVDMSLSRARVMILTAMLSLCCWKGMLASKQSQTSGLR